jgi:hypothetical protein
MQHQSTAKGGDEIWRLQELWELIVVFHDGGCADEIRVQTMGNATLG